MQTTLFTPIQVGPVTIPNRIVVPPMCMYSARSGIAQLFHKMHYGELAASGAGLVVIEASAVMPEGRITEADLGLWSEDCEAGLKAVVDLMREMEPGCRIFIQISHAGRKGSARKPWEVPGALSPTDGGWRVRAPSAIPFSDKHAKPLELTFDECGDIVKAFAEAAKRAVRAGVDGVEIHMAHGYLIHQFLSPLSNERIDEYGGALENRLRFAKEVMNAVKSVMPQDKAVGIRVSATDWAEGGWNPDETRVLAQEAKRFGMDFIDVSTGGLVSDAVIPEGPGYQVPFAAGVREKTGLPVIAAGLIKEAWQAETILREGACDLVGVARAMLDDPHWGWHAARALGVKKIEGLAIPHQYERGLKI